MATTAAGRLQKELRELAKNPNPGLRALPSPSNLLEWHYVLEGDKDSDYAGGFYHGKIVFPPQYPFKPPSISMLTPSGRFEPGARICLSISDYHPESWNPLWGVSMILLGLQSFFYESATTTGALRNVSAAEKRRCAAQSLGFNAKNMTYKRLFPDLVELAEQRRLEKANKTEEVASPAATTVTNGKIVEEKNKPKKENADRVAVKNSNVPPQQQPGAAPRVAQINGAAGGGGGGDGRELVKPPLGAKALVIGAAALVVAVAVAVAVHQVNVYV